MEKTNKRLQADLDDATVELDQNRSVISQLEKKQRQFDKALSDERHISAKIAEERDQAERTAREKETKAISLSHECDELRDRVSFSSLPVLIVLYRCVKTHSLLFYEINFKRTRGLILLKI